MALPLRAAGLGGRGRRPDTGAVAAPEPSDEEIVARLRSAGPAEVAALRAAVDKVRRAASASDAALTAAGVLSRGTSAQLRQSKGIGQARTATSASFRPRTEG